MIDGRMASGEALEKGLKRPTDGGNAGRRFPGKQFDQRRRTPPLGGNRPDRSGDVTR